MKHARKLAIIHTTAVTVEPFRSLAAELLDGCEIVNFVDDSILPQLTRNGGDLRSVEPRLLQYCRFAQEVGAEAILSACSSVGELVGEMRRVVNVPVVRVDEAMAERAVRLGQRIGVVATLSTTLSPTLALLEATARAADKPVTLEPVLVDAAYERLAAGDRQGHDDLLTAALETLASQVDVAVLAQASMARVLPRLAPSLRQRFLTSPRLAMERVKDVLEAKAAYPS